MSDKIVVDGKEYTAEELKSAILRQEDYTKKTQEVAASRKELETLKAELMQKETSLASVMELAQALEENGELAKEVEAIAKKYNGKGGDNPPAPGTPADNAMKAELEAVKKQMLEMQSSMEQERTATAYNKVMASIGSAIDKTDLDLNDIQKKVIEESTWSAIMKKQANEKTMMTGEEINAYVKETCEKAFAGVKLAKKVAGATTFHQVGDNSGMGGVQTKPEEVPASGTPEHSKWFMSKAQGVMERLGLKK